MKHVLPTAPHARALYMGQRAAPWITLHRSFTLNDSSFAV